MAKDRWAIEKAKELAKLQNRTRTLVPQIYASFCKVLMDENGNYKWDAQQVLDLFIQTQDAWTECANNNEIEGMIKWCEEVTGVELRDGNYKDSEVDD